MAVSPLEGIMLSGEGKIKSLLCCSPVGFQFPSRRRALSLSVRRWIPADQPLPDHRILSYLHGRNAFSGVGSRPGGMPLPASVIVTTTLPAFSSPVNRNQAPIRRKLQGAVKHIDEHLAHPASIRFDLRKTLRQSILNEDRFGRGFSVQKGDHVAHRLW